MGWPSLMPYKIGWWCNNHLEKYEFVNGKDDIPYILEITHVPNHQAVKKSFCGAKKKINHWFFWVRVQIPTSSLFEGAPTYKNSPNRSVHTPWKKWSFSRVNERDRLTKDKKAFGCGATELKDPKLNDSFDFSLARWICQTGWYSKGWADAGGWDLQVWWNVHHLATTAMMNTLWLFNLAMV